MLFSLWYLNYGGGLSGSYEHRSWCFRSPLTRRALCLQVQECVGMEGIGKLPIIVIALAAWTASSALGQQTQAAGDQNVVSFLAPGRSVQAGALQQLGGQNQPPANQVRVGSSPAERGQPSWGAYLTSTDTEDVSNGPTKVRPYALMLLLALMQYMRRVFFVR